MNNNSLSLKDILRAQYVKRWTIVNTSKAQTLAEHTFNVMAITRELCKRMGVDDVLPMKYAFDHDLDEILHGDMPTPAKARLDISTPYNGKSKERCDTVALSIVKLADIIDAYIFILENGVGDHANQVKEYMRIKLDNEVFRLLSLGESQTFWESVNVGDIIRGIIKDIKFGEFVL